MPSPSNRTNGPSSLRDNPRGRRRFPGCVPASRPISRISPMDAVLERRERNLRSSSAATARTEASSSCREIIGVSCYRVYTVSTRVECSADAIRGPRKSSHAGPDYGEPAVTALFILRDNLRAIIHAISHRDKILFSFFFSPHAKSALKRIECSTLVATESPSKAERKPI